MIDSQPRKLSGLETGQGRIRPVGNGVIGSEGTSCDLGDEHATRPTQTVPYGTGRSSTAFQAINCLATIIQSLRDKNRSTV